MGLRTEKLQAYVNKPLGGLRSGSNIAALRQNHYVSNPNLQNRIAAYDRTYGQSPDVTDYANAGQLLKAPVLRHIVTA